ATDFNLHDGADSAFIVSLPFAVERGSRTTECGDACATDPACRRVHEPATKACSGEPYERALHQFRLELFDGEFLRPRVEQRTHRALRDGMRAPERESSNQRQFRVSENFMLLKKKRVG